MNENLRQEAEQTNSISVDLWTGFPFLSPLLEPTNDLQVVFEQAVTYFQSVVPSISNGFVGSGFESLSFPSESPSERSPGSQTPTTGRSNDTANQQSNQSGQTNDSQSPTNRQTVIQYRWLDDEEVYACLFCFKEFDFFTRKHHCRRCGGIFCSTCSNFLHQIPPDELVSMPAALASQTIDTELHRCCEKCFKLILKREQYRIRAIDCPPEELEETIDVLEFQAGRPYRIYSVRIPVTMSSGRLVKVSLDNRLWTVRIPLNICPGSTIRVRAPFSAAQLPSADVLLPMSGGISANSVVCTRCTFVNTATTEAIDNCEMCGALLDVPLPASIEAAATSQRIPRVKVIGFDEIVHEDREMDNSEDEDDMYTNIQSILMKEYSIAVPKGVFPGEVFAVKLDDKLYSIVCPNGVRPGMLFVALVPHIKPPYALQDIHIPGVDDVLAQQTKMRSESDEKDEAVDQLNALTSEDIDRHSFDSSFSEPEGNDDESLRNSHEKDHDDSASQDASHADPHEEVLAMAALNTHEDDDGESNLSIGMISCEQKDSSQFEETTLDDHHQDDTRDTS